MNPGKNPEENVPNASAEDADNVHQSPEAGRVDSAGAAPAQADTGDASVAPAVEPSGDPRVDEILGEIEPDAMAAESGDPAGTGAETVADGTVGSSVDELSAKLAAAEARADENWDRMLRMQADVENKSKRAQRDVQNARKFALENVASDLLPIADSLEMGLAAAREETASVESIREGSELTLKMLASALEKHNIMAVDPVGEKFDPEFHQAMSMQPAAEGTEPNTVISVMQKGYTLNDRLIRPALVMVAK